LSPSEHLPQATPATLAPLVVAYPGRVFGGDRDRLDRLDRLLGDEATPGRCAVRHCERHFRQSSQMMGWQSWATKYEGTVSLGTKKRNMCSDIGRIYAMGYGNVWHSLSISRAYSRICNIIGYANIYEYRIWWEMIQGKEGKWGYNHVITMLYPSEVRETDKSTVHQPFSLKESSSQNSRIGNDWKPPGTFHLSVPTRPLILRTHIRVCPKTMHM